MSEQFDFKINGGVLGEARYLFGLGLVALPRGLYVSGHCRIMRKTTSDAVSKLNIVASFYPMYDFAKKVAGDNDRQNSAGHCEPSTKDM